MRTVGATREETGRRIFDAAVRVFAAKGFAAAGIRELATEAKLTSAALYHYMGTKEDLLVEIMRSTIEPLTAAGGAILERDDAPETQLAMLVEVHVWMHGTRPLATTITDTELRALRDERRDEVMELRDGYDMVWRTVVAAGISASRFHVPDERVAVLGLLEMCTGVSRWYRPGGRLSLQELCGIHADLAFGLLRARRGNRPLRRTDLSLPDLAELLPVQSEVAPLA